MRLEQGKEKVQKLVSAWRAGEVYAAAVVTTTATTTEAAWRDVKERCPLTLDGKQRSINDISYKISFAVL